MRSLISSLLVISLGACGGDDDGGGGGGSALHDFVTRFPEAFCAKAVSCCTMDEIPMYFDGSDITNEASCVRFYGLFFMYFEGRYETSIAEGKMVFDAGAANGCLAAEQALTCDEFAASVDALNTKCENPFQGQLANGEVCAYDEECQTRFCDGDTINDPPMTGICKDLPGVGQECDSFQCAEGLYCESSGTPDICSMPKADGAPCRDDDACMSGDCVGDTAISDGSCRPATICNGV